MNKKDIILIVIVALVSLISLLVMYLQPSKEAKALVYYEDKLVLTIKLDQNIETFTIKGFLGDVVIEKNQGKIRVKEETSPLHICSKQGYISKSYETLVCLPNKVVVKIVDVEQLDTVVR